MVKSHPKIPRFGGYEAGIAFALWLRSELKERPPETRRILAQIAEVCEETVTNWTKGASALSPGFAKSLLILDALDGREEFWARLTGSDASLVDHARTAIAAVNAIRPNLSNHPPEAALEETLDLLIQLQRDVADMTEMVRTTQKLRAYERERNGATPIRPRAVE